MTRFPAVGGGLSTAYTYVRDGYPSDAEEGESLYHVTENRAYVFDGGEWIEQTVTDHGELSGVGASDHHSRPTSTNNAGGYTTDTSLGGGNDSEFTLPIIIDRVEDVEGAGVTYYEDLNGNRTDLGAGEVKHFDPPIWVSNLGSGSVGRVVVPKSHNHGV